MKSISAIWRRNFLNSSSPRASSVIVWRTDSMVCLTRQGTHSRLDLIIFPVRAG
ncbi:MAG TPA: hypothetical protein PK573_12930 [Spirochaetota bacterium]|nr:hypothetical protein [Spirochaetota bacterium]